MEIQTQTARREQTARTAPRQLSIKEADLANAEANVEAASAQLKRAELNLSFCHVVSPVHGIVTQRSAEIGNRVSEAQPLMMVVATPDTWITANFKETQLAKMYAGQRAKVHVDALKKDLEGTVESIPAITGARSSELPPENATGNYIKVVQRCRSASASNQTKTVWSGFVRGCRLRLQYGSDRSPKELRLSELVFRGLQGERHVMRLGIHIGGRPFSEQLSDLLQRESGSKNGSAGTPSATPTRHFCEALVPSSKYAGADAPFVPAIHDRHLHPGSHAGKARRTGRRVVAGLSS